MELIYLTCAGIDEARKIAKALLEKRLIACANIYPIESMYLWKGGVEVGGEHAVLCKSLEGRFDEIRSEVKRLHSYEVPCVIRIPAEADEAFLGYMRKEI